jgi:putative FmdB family regulatory protein
MEISSQSDYNFGLEEDFMPIYQYRCLNCKRRFEAFMTYSQYGAQAMHCAHCGSKSVQRRIGRVRFARSEDSRLEDLADPSGLEGLEDDPKALGRMMRKMKSEMGSEVDGELGPEFDEVVDRLEKGQNPEEIEQAIPDLGGEAPGGMDDDF